jgi:hypothetical protein
MRLGERAEMFVNVRPGSSLIRVEDESNVVNAAARDTKSVVLASAKAGDMPRACAGECAWIT